MPIFPKLSVNPDIHTAVNNPFAGCIMDCIESSHPSTPYSLTTLTPTTVNHLALTTVVDDWWINLANAYSGLPLPIRLADDQAYCKPSVLKHHLVALIGRLVETYYASDNNVTDQLLTDVVIDWILNNDKIPFRMGFVSYASQLIALQVEHETKSPGVRQLMEDTFEECDPSGLYDFVMDVQAVGNITQDTFSQLAELTNLISQTFPQILEMTDE